MIAPPPRSLYLARIHLFAASHLKRFKMTQASNPSNAAPHVQHLRQVLLWPLRLMPEPGSDRAPPQPWQILSALGNDPAAASPWRELVDEFGAGSDGFQERHYNEFVTFLPFVQRFLYGQASGGA